IAPCYSNAVVHVHDASKSVGVANSLMSETLKGAFLQDVDKEFERLRNLHYKTHSDSKIIPLSEARKNKLKVDWAQVTVKKPSFIGNRSFTDFPMEEIAAFIDWTPFFHTWELKGSYPKIFDDPQRGVEAKKLFNDAQEMLNKIMQEKWITANAVIGFYPANANTEDDILIYADDQQKNLKTTLRTLRQQTLKPKGHFNLALADFVAPADSGKVDYVGGFAVTTGIGIEKWIEKFDKDFDDYSSIMLKALADRLAEAFAELMHLKVRKELWGYANTEALSREELIKEKYQGIRPAQGYPACPDHTEKLTQFELFEVEKNTGITLTESMAMYPTSSVSGMYFSHPFSQYFGLGKINKEQLEDYARRKGQDLSIIERWLSPVLI
ncbi:MAG: methionine synthase, partial [Bacteroidetes bacterium]|nr:methionine synthase [Bacteroidota bacterium]